MKKKKSPSRVSVLLQEYVLRALLFAIRVTPKDTTGLLCSLISVIARPLSKKTGEKLSGISIESSTFRAAVPSL